MKCGVQYKVSKFGLKTLQILVATPGLSAGQFGSVCWPHLRKANLLAAINLGWLCRQKLIFSRFDPPFWHKHSGGPKPRKLYYVTDKGYTVYEYYARQLISITENHHTPHSDGAGGAGDGANAQR